MGESLGICCQGLHTSIPLSHKFMDENHAIYRCDDHTVSGVIISGMKFMPFLVCQYKNHAYLKLLFLLCMKL